MSNSFVDIEGWLPGLMTNGMRTWVACYFNATREDSYEFRTTWSKVAGDRSSALSPLDAFHAHGQQAIPFPDPATSDWFVGGLVAQSWSHGTRRDPQYHP